MLVHHIAGVLVAVLLFAAGVLAYGYWHSISHGALHVTLDDVSDRERPQPIRQARVWFRDAKGTVLAQAEASGPYGVIAVSDPPAYDCRRFEQAAPYSTVAGETWRQCFERQSRWLMTWVRAVRSADVQAGDCHARGLPVAVTRSGDAWWLWWVPVAHVGGDPYTSLGIRLELDRRRC